MTHCEKCSQAITYEHLYVGKNCSHLCASCFQVEQGGQCKVTFHDRRLIVGRLRVLADSIERTPGQYELATVEESYDAGTYVFGSKLELRLRHVATAEELRFGPSPVRAAMRSFDELRQLQDNLIASLGVPPHLVGSDFPSPSALAASPLETREALRLLVNNGIGPGPDGMIHAEVIEPPDSPPCTCDIMLTGCVCGAMQREREKAG